MTLISIAKAKAEFEVGRSTLYRLIDAGRITAHTREAGRPRIYVDPRELRAILTPRPKANKPK